jgi:pyruvate,water dikinase
MEAKCLKTLKAINPGTKLCVARQVFVAVRSSATAEDLPDASFAVSRPISTCADDVFNAVRKCWASLYGARAIFYRVEQGFEHDKVNLSAIVQKMVDSEKSGVMFSSQPSTGEPLVVIEALGWRSVVRRHRQLYEERQ